MKRGEVTKSATNKTWYFRVFWGSRSYANFVSASYRTKGRAQKALTQFLATGGIDWNGDSEASNA
jgi:hypothetical protein